MRGAKSGEVWASANRYPTVTDTYMGVYLCLFADPPPQKKRFPFFLKNQAKRVASTKRRAMGIDVAAYGAPASLVQMGCGPEFSAKNHYILVRHRWVLVWVGFMPSIYQDGETPSLVQGHASRLWLR